MRRGLGLVDVCVASVAKCSVSCGFCVAIPIHPRINHLCQSGQELLGGAVREASPRLRLRGQGRGECIQKYIRERRGEEFAGKCRCSHDPPCRLLSGKTLPQQRQRFEFMGQPSTIARIPTRSASGQLVPPLDDWAKSVRHPQQERFARRQAFCVGGGSACNFSRCGNRLQVFKTGGTIAPRRLDSDTVAAKAFTT